MDSNMKSVLRSYVLKCGEGRGLEKFLRRNSYSSGDERETTASITTSKSNRNKTKSLESLHEPPPTTAKQEATQTKSPKTPPSRKEQSDAECSKPMESTKVVVKQSGEKVDKKKSFNYESVIEITLPQQPPQIQQIPIAERSEDKLEEPIKPVICTPKQSKIPLQPQTSEDKKMSPSSGNDESFSNKQNPLMEWDSFIPGFETETSVLATNNMQLCNPMELDDSELNALKTYFHQRGLQLPNENLVVVIKNRQEKVSERQFENIRRNKEKWQSIYEKYKEKYHHSTLSFQDPDAQSTPKIPETSVSKVSEPQKSAAMEKGSQTSLVKNAVKSIQVETSSLCRDQTKTTVDEKTQEQFEVYHNPSVVAESFEFVRGSRPKEAKTKKSSSDSSKESNSKKSTSTASEAGSSKNSGISMSERNDNITNFDDSLKVAIALLNSLLDSSMRPELKRNLAEKVIQKIVQLQTSRSIQTSTLESSGIYPQSNSSAVPSVKAKPVENKNAQKNREEVLKNCFQPMTKSEVSHQSSQHEEDSLKETVSSESIPKSQLVDFVKREKQSQLKWIEKEIEHLNNLRDLLRRNETPLPTNKSCPIYENMTALRNKAIPEKPPAPDVNVWNSHANMKKVKNRSKLETPETHEESLASFIDTKNKKFLEKYNKHQKQMYEEINAYTRPYSSGSRPKPPTVVKSRKTQMTANKDVQTSTSLASSSVFESDASMSVPVNTNSQPSTSHQDNKKKQKVASAVTQTTDSICRTKPIYEVRNDEKCGTMSTVTRRVHKMQNDKQLQCNPPSIKYTLTFDKKNKPNVRQCSSLPQRSEYATITKSSKDMYNQISYTASLNYERYVENKENYNDILLSTDNCDDDEDIDLQKCFNHNRPETFTRFEERKKCIDELKKLRALRNEHRSKLLLLTSEKSLEGKLFSSLPDLPLKTTRMFSTKAIKRHTKKVVKNLTEVQQKKKEENLKNLKRKTRLMTEIFNKNLQKNVLKGNLNLSNTVNLIAK